MLLVSEGAGIHRAIPVTPPPWVGSVGLTIAVGIAYFLAAWLSFALAMEPHGVSAFWPAAGFGVGVLLGLGSGARWPVIVGVFAATIAVNVSSGRHSWSMIIFAACNAGEAVFIARLVEHFFGPSFNLDKLQRVLGLFAAAVVGLALSGIVGALSYKMSDNLTEPVLTIWYHWIVAGTLGVIAVAPLIIQLPAALRAPPPWDELIEGAGALVALAAATEIIILALPQTWWEMSVLVTLLFPLLLWPAARCQPVFSAAAVFVVAFLIVLSITFDIGHFNKANPPLDGLVLSARISIFGVAFCALVLASLFAERRQREADLVASEARLRMAQRSTGVGIWDRDWRSGALRWTPELEEIYGLEAKSVRTYSDFRDRVHPDDIENLEACRDAAIRKRERYLLEFRIIRPSGEVRWVASTGSASYDPITGEPIRVLGNNFDITERKRAEERQKMLMAELDHRVKNALARIGMLVTSTRKEGTTIDNYVSSLQGRIQSMAVAHSLLSQSGWQDVGLGALVGKQLAPYASGSNVTIEGEDIMLGPAAIQALAMSLHELVTNAAKYGALSKPDGQVAVSWDNRSNGDAAASLVLVWQERGGPPVAAKVSSGYGTRLIRDLIPYELGGAVDLAFAPDGVNCRIELPLERI